MSLAQIETLYAAYEAAADAADWDTAITKLMAIKLRLLTTPNITKPLAGGNHRIDWNQLRGEIDTMIARCERYRDVAARAVSGPFTQVKVTYARAGQETGATFG